jgi:hypothetical protein
MSCAQSWASRAGAQYPAKPERRVAYPECPRCGRPMEAGYLVDRTSGPLGENALAPAEPVGGGGAGAQPLERAAPSWKGAGGRRYVPVPPMLAAGIVRPARLTWL